MAVIRNTASQRRVGKVGSDTYYIANGQQIVRQAQNNSNYGASASRTEAQMVRRVKWGNLVNVYKACRYWMPKAFETKSRKQSDYNRFMSVNINSSKVALTKDQALNGCAVIDEYTVSQGSITPISQQFGSSEGSGVANFITDIKCTMEIDDTTTIGAYAKNIIENNPTFQAGDNIAFIYFKNSYDDRNYPYLQSVYNEFTLDVDSTALFSTTAFSNLVTIIDGYICVAVGKIASLEATACVMIHTRKVNGSLYVSTQDVSIYNETFVEEFSSEAWVQSCIQTYGLTEEVPLDPSFRKASIDSITANGSQISKGDTFTSSQAVVITGDNLTSENVKLYKDDTLYTPLAKSEGSWEYMLGDNGSYTIYVNGYVYLKFSISGIEVPSWLPVYTRAWLQSNTEIGQSASGYKDAVTSNSSNCINYPYKSDDEFAWFGLHYRVDEIDLTKLSYANCTLVNNGFENNTYRLVMSVIDKSQAGVVYYDGFIIAVFNYSD